MDYRYGSHTVYQIDYHLWVTKYRYKELTEPNPNEDLKMESAKQEAS